MLSVVMPAHNESGLLEESVGEVVDGLRASPRPFEVIVVENGSTDATAAIAERLGAILPELRLCQLVPADYGAALRTGLLASRGEIVVTFDVDYYDLGFLEHSVGLLDHEPGLALVVGSKRVAGAIDARPLVRRVVTAVFVGVLRVGFGMRVTDTHGMKAMRRSAVESLARACRFDRDLFDTELVLRAERSGLRIAQLPVTVEERRPSRTSIWRRAPGTLIGLVRLRFALGRAR